MKLVVLLLLALVGLSLALPLDDYVNAPDPKFVFDSLLFSFLFFSFTTQ